MTPPSLGPLSLLFLRIGNLTVGGGEPTLAALQRELSRRGWLNDEQFGLAFALARITPGTNLLAFCAAAGWYALGLGGAAAAVLMVTIPSSVLVVWLTQVCEAGDRLPWLGAAVSAVIAAVVGLMAATALRLARTQTSGRSWLMPLLLVSGAFALRAWGVSPIATLAAAAAVGCFWRRA